MALRYTTHDPTSSVFRIRPSSMALPARGATNYYTTKLDIVARGRGGAPRESLVITDSRRGCARSPEPTQPPCTGPSEEFALHRRPAFRVRDVLRCRRGRRFLCRRL